ncbi:hypothetical protein TNCV_3790101 [Trichonephila clavipes]|nr:hypothetical protein TNCV_3790101 [Trichonephila clavipes]
MMDHVATSRTIAQHIQSVTHHSMHTRTLGTNCNTAECPQGVYCFVYPRQEPTDVCAANGAMKDSHEQRNGTTLCLETTTTSACNITMVGFKFGDIEPECSSDLSPINNVAPACTTTGLEYTTHCYTRSSLAISGTRMVCCTPKIHPKPL